MNSSDFRNRYEPFITANFWDAASAVAAQEQEQEQEQGY